MNFRWNITAFADVDEDFPMTPKEKILGYVSRFEDDMTRDQILYELDLYIHVEQGMKAIEEGRVIDHDELFDKLLKECDEDEKSRSGLVGASGGKSSANQKLHRQGQPKGGSKVRKAVASIRRKPA